MRAENQPKRGLILVDSFGQKLDLSVPTVLNNTNHLPQERGAHFATAQAELAQQKGQSHIAHALLDIADAGVKAADELLR